VFPDLEVMLRRHDLTLGWTNLIKIRTGTFIYVPRLVSMGFLAPRYRSVCPFCALDEEEDAVHFLLRCACWATERQELLRGLSNTQNPLLDIRKAGVLLGGGRDAAGPLHPGILEATALYLCLVIPQRAAMLRGMTP